jgi:uncharacterized protein YdhG (YjbR/CyaY superfamily)
VLLVVRCEVPASPQAHLGHHTTESCTLAVMSSSETTSTKKTSTKPTSKPATVDEYIATLPPEIQERVALLRETIAATIPTATETIRYAIPAVMMNNRYVVHYAAWKHHIGLYPIPSLPEALEAEVSPLRSMKDTVRLVHSKPLPIDLISRLLVQLLAQRDAETQQ